MTTAKRFGYARVSTTSQTNDRQLDALTAAGIDPADIFTDKISGARQSRPGLDDLLSRVRPGDSITVHSFDRLGRTALHVFQTLADLEEKGVTVYSLKGTEQQFSGATGKFLRDVLILVAELERSMNQERVAEARAAKAARAEAGDQIAGRPITAMTAENIRKVRKLKDKGRSVAEIVKLTGISRASVYRALSDK
ncbi:recombinase family protein [Microbacterium caowuchunii]|uniref:Recombinase family protein n=1 Tax=Microbacterium caowuchunii TaxID=2614638 RepID=A0A5N0T9J2_9MICO|nr:recombinase family protein [Microbacterium caowuchunii]KAA9131164.1 recombinase family protein [Microbacterium caowuchunii]